MRLGQIAVIKVWPNKALLTKKITSELGESNSNNAKKR